MLTIHYVLFFVWTILGVLSVAFAASILLSIRRRRRANLPHFPFDHKLAVAAIFTAMFALTIVGTTAVQLWPSSTFSWAFLVLVNVLLQPFLLRGMKSGLFELCMTIRGRVADTGEVDHELNNLPLRERRWRLWPRAIGEMLLTALTAGWSFACLSPFF